MFSVELLPDPRLDQAVREDWSRLVDAGLPSAGRNPAAGNRPHITLAVRDALALSDLDGVAAALPLPITLSGVLLFGRHRFVLTRHVVVGEPLRELHVEVAARLGTPEARYANTAPGHWSPHITLARGLDPERLARGLRAILAPSVSGEAIGLRVWDAATRTVTTLG